MKKIAINENETDEPTRRSADAEDAPRQTESQTETSAQNDRDDSVAELQADLDRFRDLAMRSQADFENYKKRAAREKEEGIRYANKDLLERLVAIVDNFEKGLEAA